MIIYFADRHLNILGQATTHLPEGVKVLDDLKTEDIETGVAIFECDIHFDKKTRAKVEEWAEVGNYILRSSDNEGELYSIIDAKIDTKKQKAYIYAEDNGLDLLNDLAEAYSADKPYPISHYINLYASGAGWTIGINEVEGLTKQLTFDSEQTASARLLDIAEAFNNCELSFGFAIEGLRVTKKYINIHETRGKDTGIPLRLNKEIDGIITTKSIANLATALKATGGTPENAESPITLLGYSYDNGDFYIEGDTLKSRKALARWSRYLWRSDESEQLGGHIVKPFSSDTISQAVLCEQTIAELKKVCDMEVNYEADIKKLPDNVKIGDRVDIVDDAGELYISSRILTLETSIANNSRRAVIGEHLIKNSGISAKVEQLAAEFAKITVSATRAKVLAENAKSAAESALEQAETAKAEAEAVQGIANDAKNTADSAAESANNAKAEAQAAQAAVNKVEESVSSIETTVNNAQQAAQNAQNAANTANEKAEEAKQAAENAQEDANTAKETAETAKSAADNAINTANLAKTAAETAKNEAETATETAIAAKIDAEQAEKDIAAFEDSLESVTNTMKAEYARKTELTEATADLQTQITKSAGELKSTAQKLVVIDETANKAMTHLGAAQKAAELAQEQADTATAQAEAAQAAANEALQAANAAQAEANTAKAAYDTARTVADQAEADLIAAQKDLATVQARADATEEEIAQAQAAVDAAQITASNAVAEANTAKEIAENALNVAISAVDNANKAQATANNAAQAAEIALQNLETANGNVESAQDIANEAIATAEAAQETANTAKAEAESAQATADEANATATEAQETATAAVETLNNANNDLAQAQTRLEAVLANVDATEEEIAAAQADVETAQAAADTAKTNAETAQAAADAAKAEAENAQTAADNAKVAADEVQKVADEAQKAADNAQGYVYALAKRMTEAETNINQTAKSLTLSAKQVEQIQDGYGNRIASLESQLQILADSISTLIVGADGTSYMEQTANGWSFNIGAMQKDIENLTSELNVISSNISIGENEAGQPIIELKVVDENNVTSTFKAEITNTGIHFYEGTSLPATIEDGALKIEKAEVKEELRQGGFVWATRANGNLGLSWKGG